ncbi:hypothetical protein DCC81_03235 [Chitinophaga parva]|uniref:Uncharacterized protein n=1 Tax=Chitinophaga parva TaxID=2169414 RepID=A0A2T7BLF9_9BACT|nr:hypothetical protein [Chitinophaga parva]PUZ28512.1 hypothetical protein DCC81_03235 [Chitinophaga parva]
MGINNNKNPMEGYNAKDRNFQKTADDSNQIGGNTGDNEKEDVQDTAEEVVEDEIDPVLDEEDLEENHLTDEEADKIAWEPSRPQVKQPGKQ